jgi:hypothetical protein
VSSCTGRSPGIGQGLLRLLVDERGQPHQRGEAPVCLLASEPVDHLRDALLVLPRAVARLVEGVVEDDAQVLVLAGAEDVVVREARVLVHDADAPLPPAPVDGPAPRLVLDGDPHLLEEDLAYAHAPGVLVAELAAVVEDAPYVDGVEHAAHLGVGVALDVDGRGDARPLLDQVRDHGRLLVRHPGFERAAVQVHQARRGEALEHRRVRHEALEEHGLGDARLGAAHLLGAARAAEAGVEVLPQELAALGGVGLVLLADVGEEIPFVDAPRLLVEPLDRGQVAGLAVRDDVEEVAHGHDLAELEVGQVADEQVGELAQGRALALEGGAQRDHHLDERGGEGVDAPEVVRVALVPRELAEVHREVALVRGERGVYLGLLFRQGVEDALLDDAAEVLVLELDHLEAVFPEREVIAEDDLVVPHGELAHHLREVALAGGEGQERDRGRVVAVLDEGRDLGRLLRELLRVLEGGEPEDELVEEEDGALVAEALEVLGQDLQAGAENFARWAWSSGCRV